MRVEVGLYSVISGVLSLRYALSASFGVVLVSLLGHDLLLFTDFPRELHCGRVSVSSLVVFEQLACVK